MPESSHTRFSSLELAKVFIEEGNLYAKLSAFLFLSERLSSRRIFAKREAKSSEHFFSVIQLSNIRSKHEKAVTLENSFREPFALPLLKPFSSLFLENS